jgi:hypothetical protein
MGMGARRRGRWPSVTKRAAGQPSGQYAYEGQAHGDERIREVTFRPVCRPAGAALSARHLSRPRLHKTCSERGQSGLALLFVRDWHQVFHPEEKEEIDDENRNVPMRSYRGERTRMRPRAQEDRSPGRGSAVYCPTPDRHDNPVVRCSVLLVGHRLWSQTTLHPIAMCRHYRQYGRVQHDARPLRIQ